MTVYATAIGAPRNGLPPGGRYLWRGQPALAALNAAIVAARPPGYTPPVSRGTAEHGTTARYRRHRRDGEPACDACLEAERHRNRARASGMSRSEASKALWDRRRAGAA